MKQFLAGMLLMVPSICYSALLPTGIQYKEVGDFSGGLNTSVPSHKLDDKFSPNMRNVFIHRKPGAVIKSNGFINAGSTSTLTDGRFMFTFNNEDGTKEFIVSDGSSVLSTQDFQSYVMVSSGLNRSVNLDMAQVRNKVWITNGSDPVIVWDGTNRQILNHVSKARYIEFFQERVFLLNTSLEGSSLDFSEITSTDGVALTPEDVRAWPATNRLYVGRGDGQVGTALWPYKSQLQIGKERSIYTLYGTGVTSYYVRKSESDIGVQSNDSVVVQDGYTYFKNIDGIYAWDGGIPARISDAINPDMASIIQTNNNVRTLTWDTQSEFSAGEFIGSTATADGSVTIFPPKDQPNSGNAGGYVTVYPLNAQGPYITFGTTYSPNRQFTDWVTLTSTFALDRTFFGRSAELQIKAKETTSGSCSLVLRVRNNNTGEIVDMDNIGSIGKSFSPIRFDLTSPLSLKGTGIYGYDLQYGTFSLQITSHAASNSGCTFDIYDTSESLKSFWLPSLSYQYISDVRRSSNSLGWANFNADYTNGSDADGSVAFFLRASTSSVNITTATWVPTFTGANIQVPLINNFIQFASTITNTPTPNPVSSATLYDVSITYNTGLLSKDRPFAISWNNEYWLSVATETSGLYGLQYIKSWITNANPNAWNLLDGLNIRSFTKDGNSVLYGGSASTGTFYRLDYGMTYDNSPIVSYYDTPDMDFGDTFREKGIQILNINSEKENDATLSVGISSNSGVSFSTTVAVNLTGSGELYKPIFGLSTLRGNQYRIRLSNSQLGRGLTFYGLGIWYLPKDIWTNTEE